MVIGKLKAQARKHTTALVLILLFISWVNWGTITGSVTSVSPTTIRTSATYTFRTVNSRILTANEYFRIVFPSDFDFSSEASSSVSKTWTAGTNMDATLGISSCSLARDTRTLTVILGASTTSRTITFSVAGIINAQYAKTTSGIVISSFTSGSVAIDASGSSSFTVTPTAGALEVTLTSETSTVGETEKLTFSLALTNGIASTGKVTIFLPKWNADAPSPESIFQSASPICSSITNVNAIYCAFTQNVDSEGTQDKIVITGIFTNGATSISFSIDNYRNPPSTAPLTTMLVQTSTDTEANVIDKDESISLTMTNPWTLSSSDVEITPSNYEINAVTTYTVSITVTNPMPVGSLLLITFPAEISPSSASVEVVGSGKINQLASSDYDTTTKVLTLNEIIIEEDDYVYPGDEISIQLLNIINPSSTSTTGSFTISTMESVDYSIDTISTGVTITALPGDITTFTVSPTNTKIRERTKYQFTIVTENDVEAGSSLVVTIPSDISVDSATDSSCISAATELTASSATCTTSGNVLTISDGFSSAVTAGTTVTFTVSGLLSNAETSKETSNFGIQSIDSNGNIIDMYDGTDVTLTFAANTLEELTVTPSSTYTGVETTYTISIKPQAGHEVLQNSYVRVIFPSSIIIGDNTTSENSCTKVSGFPDAISCEFNETNSLLVTNGFSSSSEVDETYIFTIGGIRNPRSTATTLSFKVYIQDSDDNFQYSITSGEGIAVSDISDFTAVTVASASTINAATTTYTFTITLSNVINNGDYIQVVFPSEIGISSTTNQWAGVKNLSSSLTCSVKSKTIDITVSLESGVSQLPAVAGNTNTDIKFTISNVVNPPSTVTSSSFEIYVLTSNQNNKINQRTTGMTITNTAAGSFTNTTAGPDDSTIGVTTSYLFSFRPSTSIYQNTVIKVTLPSQISLNTSQTLECTAVLVIESTMSCNYDSSSRIITITDGFLTKTSYISSQVEFRISSLINPSTALTTDSFIIQTMTSNGELYDSISNGVTYTKAWNSPCLTWSPDLDTCTSCDSDSTFPYLSGETCVTSWPSGQYLSSESDEWEDCTSPCNTCTTSSTHWTTCISSYFLLDNECIDSCPSMYEVDDDGLNWTKVGESVIPFIPFGLYIIIWVFLWVAKAVKKETILTSCLIIVTSYFLIFLIPIICILMYRDAHYQSASVVLVWFLIHLVINFLWTCFIYRTEIRKDVLFDVWLGIYTKTEKFIYITSYAICFQWFRLSFCRLLNRPRFEASVHMSEMMFIKLNRFSIMYMLLVLVPVFLACIYNLVWTTYQRQLFWHDIELVLIIFWQLILLIIDVWTKDESSLSEKYINKNEISTKKDVDINDKSMINNTIMTTKGDMLKYTEPDVYIPKQDDENDILRKAVYYQLGMNPYHSNFEQYIKTFTKNQDKEEDVISNYSSNRVANKDVNDMNPFKDKYDEREKGFIGMYTNYNTNSPKKNQSPMKERENLQFNYKSDGNNRFRRMFKPSPPTIGHGKLVFLLNSIGGDTIIRNSDSLYNLDPQDDFIDDSNLPKNNDTVLRDMMRTQNPAFKMPHFPVENESVTVLKARQELRNEVEMVSKAQEENNILDDDIKEMSKELKQLERQKLLAKQSIEISESISSFNEESEEQSENQTYE